MDKLDYSQIKEFQLEDFHEYISVDHFTPEQALAALFEESVLMMKKDKDNYISVIITAAVIGLQQSDLIAVGVLERLQEILRKGFKQYNCRSHADFLADKAYLENRLPRQDYTVFQGEYPNGKHRADILLDQE